MRILFFLSVLALAPMVASAQETNSARTDTVEVMTEIELRDGSRFVGVITEETSEFVVLKTTSGTEVRVRKAEIVSRREIAGRVSDGGFSRFDPNYTRLLFGPTGRPLGEGEGYFAAYYVFFGLAAYGLTDRVTVAAGSFLIPSIVTELIYVAPKVALYQRGSSAASVGVLAGMASGHTAGVMYGAWTKGQPDGAVTLGLGFGFAEGDVAADPVILVGGEKSLGRRTKLVAEGYFLPTVAGGAFAMGGIRFFGSRLTADLGLMGLLLEDAEIPAVPWISFAYNFGQ